MYIYIYIQGVRTYTCGRMKASRCASESTIRNRFSVNVWAVIIVYMVEPYLLSTRLGDLYEVFLRHVLHELLDDVPLCVPR